MKFKEGDLVVIIKDSTECSVKKKTCAHDKCVIHMHKRILCSVIAKTKRDSPYDYIVSPEKIIDPMFYPLCVKKEDIKIAEKEDLAEIYLYKLTGESYEY